jgi:muramoyltetrapeptide carboxypeptidase
MNPFIPPRLNRGDCIRIISPASPITDTHDLELGVRYLESEGFRVEIGTHALHKSGYLAGTDEQRLQDLMDAFDASHVKAIFCSRGGYGCMRLLDKLDYSRIKQHGKILLGYSDITALHLSIYRNTGLVTYVGPMVTSELCKSLDAYTETNLWRMLMEPHDGTFWEDEEAMYGSYRKLHRVEQLEEQPLPLLGGNLCLCSILAGTRFFPQQPAFYLALEEIEEPPYRMDRMLSQLVLTEKFNAIQGLLLGRITSERGKKTATGDDLEKNIKYKKYMDTIFYSDFFKSIPIIGELPFGHQMPMLTIPHGNLILYRKKETHFSFDFT